MVPVVPEVPLVPMVPEVPLVPVVSVVPEVSLVPVVPVVPEVPLVPVFLWFHRFPWFLWFLTFLRFLNLEASAAAVVLPHVILWNPIAQFPMFFQHEVLCPAPDCTQTLSLCRWNSGNSAGHCPRFLHDMEHITLLVPAVYQCKQGHQTISTDPIKVHNCVITKQMLELVSCQAIIFLLLFKTISTDLYCDTQRPSGLTYPKLAAILKVWSILRYPEVAFHGNSTPCVQENHVKGICRLSRYLDEASEYMQSHCLVMNPEAVYCHEVLEKWT